MRLTVGSLFSGCGGLDLGVEAAGFEIKWQCEIDKFCRKILNRHWPETPIFTDAQFLEEAPKVDVLIGGFPCQPVSLAGRKNGVNDPKWLWPLFDRAISVLRPRYIIVENVPGLYVHGFGNVLGSLALQGYDAEWYSLQSSDIGAPHRRKRVYILASNTRFPRRWEESRSSFSDERKNGRRKEIDNESERIGESRFQATALANSISGRFKKRQKGWKLQLIESFLEDSANLERGTEEKIEREEFELTDGYFGHYEEAIKYWTKIFREPPKPTDEEGRLSPYFVEWMLGFPDGWTEGLSRTQRLKMLGNSVQVQCAEIAGILLKEKIKNE